MTRRGWRGTAPRLGRTLALVAVVAACGCARSPRVDVDAAEAEIRRELRDATGVPVGAPRCPTEVPAEAGRRFRCRVAIAGQPTIVEVEQRDDEGSLNVKPTEAVVTRAHVRDDLVAALRDRVGGRGAEVVCPGPPVRVVPPGTTFRCEATDGTTTRTIVVRVRDVAGSLTFTIRGG